MDQLPYEIKVLMADYLSSQDIVSLVKAVPAWSDLQHDVSYWATRVEKEFQVPRDQFTCTPMDRYLSIQRSAIYPGCQLNRDVGHCFIQAAGEGKLDLLRYFRDRGALVPISYAEADSTSQIAQADISDYIVGRALDCAIENNHTHIVEYLLPLVRSFSHYKPLLGDLLSMLTARSNQVEMFRLLCPKLVSDDVWPLILSDAIRRDQKVIVKTLIEAQHWMSYSYGVGYLYHRAIVIATKQHNLPMVQYLVGEIRSQNVTVDFDHLLQDPAIRGNAVVLEYLTSIING